MCVLFSISPDNSVHPMRKLGIHKSIWCLLELFRKIRPNLQEKRNINNWRKIKEKKVKSRLERVSEYAILLRVLPLGIKNIVTQSTKAHTNEHIYSGKPHQSENELKTPYRVVSFLFSFPRVPNQMCLQSKAFFTQCKVMCFYLWLEKYVPVILMSGFLFFALLHFTTILCGRNEPPLWFMMLCV